MLEKKQEVEAKVDLDDLLNKNEKLEISIKKMSNDYKLVKK